MGKSGAIPIDWSSWAMTACRSSNTPDPPPGGDEACRIQPIANPFGANVLPMSPV